MKKEWTLDGNREKEEAYVGRVWALKPHDNIRKALAKIASYFMKRNDGQVPKKLGGEQGEKSTRYWMWAEKGVIPQRNDEYIFGDGKNKKNVYILHETEGEEKAKDTLWKITRLALEAAEKRIPDTHGAWSVNSKYKTAPELAWHRDEDYDASGFTPIVSFTVRGKARMHFRENRNDPGITTELTDERAYVFEHARAHMVDVRN